MTEFVHLTAEEAEKARKSYNLGTSQQPDLHAIEPIALEDGVTFILGLEVLSDVKHQAVLAEFKADPKINLDLKRATFKREVLAAEFKKSIDIDMDPKLDVQSELALEG